MQKYKPLKWKKIKKMYFPVTQTSVQFPFMVS